MAHIAALKTGSFTVLDELKHIAAEWSLPIAVIVGVAIIKAMFTKVRQDWRQLLRHLFISLFIGLLTAKYMMDLPEEDGVTTGFTLIVVTFMAFQADALVAAMLMLGKRLRDDPMGLAKEISDLVRGR